jgi:hypothetical protein
MIGLPQKIEFLLGKLNNFFFSFTCFLREQIRLYNPRTTQPATATKLKVVGNGPVKLMVIFEWMILGPNPPKTARCSTLVVGFKMSH